MSRVDLEVLAVGAMSLIIGGLLITISPYFIITFAFSLFLYVSMFVSILQQQIDHSVVNSMNTLEYNFFLMLMFLALMPVASICLTIAIIVAMIIR